ncbi:MAG: ParB/RepB/Spo0J family partition protein [Lachnospiraceae bacterium]|nr:ParB/RepB/Spo0J family partition protein [Lachnospiraceae bacterium]
MAQKRLGRGLDSLIKDKFDAPTTSASAAKAGSGDIMVSLSSIEPNREQPRSNFNDEGIEELSESIKVHGIIQPLIVKKNENAEGMYEIIAGERRWRAARLAGLSEVPVLVKEYSEQEAYEVALIENIQRQDLNAIEEALAYEKLINDFNLKQEELAKRVSKSRTAITNSLRLLKLQDKVKQLVVNGKLSAGHARALVGVKNEDKQVKLADKIVYEGLSVREAEDIVRGLDAPAKKKDEKAGKEKAPVSPEQANIEEELKAIFGTKVNIKGNSEKGKIQIEYYSQDEFERILSQLGANL